MGAKTTWAFRISNAEPDALDIDIYDVVGDDFWFGGVSAKQVREKLTAAQAVRKINVRINSAGGDVFDGFAIYNLLHSHKAKVTVIVDGLAASIASVIAMAGDKIKMAENAMMMIHNPWTIALGDGEEMRSTAEMLDKVRDQIATTYAARTGRSVAEIVDWMGAETWMTAAEALERGFATEVTPAKAIAALWNIDDRFKNAPKHVRDTAERMLAAVQLRPELERMLDANPEKQPAAKVGGEKEDDMDPKQLEADLNTAKASLATTQSELGTLKTAHAALLATCAAIIAAAGLNPEKDSVKDAGDALLKRATDAERKSIEAEVDKLVGDKLVPAERDAMVSLASKDRATFDALIAARPALNLVGPRKAVDPDAPPPQDATGLDNSAGDELSAAADARVRGN